jgi:hypothetical protein
MLLTQRTRKFMLGTLAAGALADFLALLLVSDRLLRTAPRVRTPETGNIIEFPYRGVMLFVTRQDYLTTILGAVVFFVLGLSCGFLMPKGFWIKNRR